MLTDRRSFLRAALFVAAAPIIIKTKSLAGLMPLKDHPIAPTGYWVQLTPFNEHLEKLDIEACGVLTSEMRDGPRGPEVWAKLKQIVYEGVEKKPLLLGGWLGQVTSDYDVEHDRIPIAAVI